MWLKIIKTVLACMLLMTISYGPLQTKTANAQQNTRNDLTFSVLYTNSSLTITSASSKGNFTFYLEWQSPGYIEYNGTLRMLREVEHVRFTDKTLGYAMEYWLPRLMYEYVDADNNGLYTQMNWTVPGPDIYVTRYKIHDTIEMTNVTQTQKTDGTTLLEWTYTQLAIPMESNIQPPWERFPIVKENFHYNPLNGTLKMDIILDNFKPKNDTSRVSLSYGIKYLHLQPGNETLTVTADHQEFQLAQLDEVYPTNSSIIAFKVDGIERAFFDFGGTTMVDGNSNVQVKGSIGPPDPYWLYEKNVWLAIGLNYPHINQTMVHDPYFGLSQIALAAVPPLAWTIATAAAGIALLVAVVYNYRKTKNLFRIPGKLIMLIQRSSKRTH